MCVGTGTVKGGGRCRWYLLLALAGGKGEAVMKGGAKGDALGACELRFRVAETDHQGATGA